MLTKQTHTCFIKPQKETITMWQCSETIWQNSDAMRQTLEALQHLLLYGKFNCHNTQYSAHKLTNKYEN